MLQGKYGIATGSSQSEERDVLIKSLITWHQSLIQHIAQTMSVADILTTSGKLQLARCTTGEPIKY